MEEEKTSIEFAKYRLEKAKEALISAKLLYDNNDLISTKIINYIKN